MRLIVKFLRMKSSFATILSNSQSYKKTVMNFDEVEKHTYGNSRMTAVLIGCKHLVYKCVCICITIKEYYFGYKYNLLLTCFNKV
jgi:hypothetical protein